MPYTKTQNEIDSGLALTNQQITTNVRTAMKTETITAGHHMNVPKKHSPE